MKLTINLQGQDGDDFLNAAYGSEMDGKLFLTLDGGKGKDDLNMSSNDNMGLYPRDGSAGQVHAKMLGGKGDDMLVMSIQELPGSHADIDAILDGGLDSDTYNWLFTTSNVSILNCEHSVPIILFP